MLAVSCTSSKLFWYRVGWNQYNRPLQKFPVERLDVAQGKTDAQILSNYQMEEFIQVPPPSHLRLPLSGSVSNCKWGS